MQRVAIIGVTGAGKSTLAVALGRKLHVPHVELDALHWEPDWTMAELDVFRRRVTAQVSAEGWVVDGNYSKVRDVVWRRADTVVWLDYDLPLTFARLLRRTITRMWSGTELWNGNRERFRQLLTKDSLLLWAIQTHGKYRATFPAVLASQTYAHLHVVRLLAPSDTARWLSALD